MEKGRPGTPKNYIALYASHKLIQWSTPKHILHSWCVADEEGNQCLHHDTHQHDVVAYGVDEATSACLAGKDVGPLHDDHGHKVTGLTVLEGLGGVAG